jgi:hypothetical protein
VRAILRLCTISRCVIVVLCLLSVLSILGLLSLLSLLSLLIVFALLVVLVVLTDSVRSHTSCGCTGDNVFSCVVFMVSLGRGQHT